MLNLVASVLKDILKPVVVSDFVFLILTLETIERLEFTLGLEFHDGVEVIDDIFMFFFFVGLDFGVGVKEPLVLECLLTTESFFGVNMNALLQEI